MNTIPGSLLRIIQYVTEKKQCSSDMISHIMKDSNIQIEDLNNFIRYDHPAHESYGRNLIWNGGFFKILLMTWNPGDFTAAHDHGSVEWGAVQFYGNFKHITFEYENEKLITRDETIMRDGEIAPVNSNLIHQMGNHSEKAIFSLHIYGSKNLDKNISQGSRIFDLVNNKIQITDGQAFLQLPDSLIKRTVTGLKCCQTSTANDQQIKHLYNKNSVILNNII